MTVFGLKTLEIIRYLTNVQTEGSSDTH